TLPAVRGISGSGDWANAATGAASKKPTDNMRRMVFMGAGRYARPPPRSRHDSGSQAEPGNELSAAGGDVEAAAETRVVGEEVVELLERHGIDSAHVGTAARTGHRNDGGRAVAAEHSRYTNTAAESGIEGEEALQAGAGGRERRDIRPAAGASAGDDIGQAVVIYVRRGDIDARRETLGVGEEAVEERAGA